MEGIVKAILEHSGQAGLVFIALGVLIYFMRKDSKAHRSEYTEVVKQMFAVVNKNTESNTRLSESISDLKDRMK